MAKPKRRRAKDRKKTGLSSSSLNIALMIGAVTAVVALIAYAAFLTASPLAKRASLDKEGESSGLVAFQAGDFDGAIENLEKAVADDPKDAESHRILGLSYEATGKLAKAYVEYEETLKIDPKQPEVLYNLASINKQANKKKKAIGQLKDALSINPGFLGAKLFLADLYSDTGDKSKAIKLYKEIIDAKPFGNVDDQAKKSLKKLESGG